MATNEDDIIRDGEGVRVLRDGSVLRVPLMLMDHKTVVDDGRLHKPGFRLTTDAAAVTARAAAYDDYLKSLGDGWRKPDVAPVAGDKAPIADARVAALAERDAQLRDAWRGGAQ